MKNTYLYYLTTLTFGFSHHTISDLGKLNLPVYGLFFWTQLIKRKNGRYSRCVIDICANDMQYPELHKKRSNVDRDIVMYKLPKDGAVKAAWISTMLKGRKQLIQESLQTFVMTSLLD